MFKTVRIIWGLLRPTEQRDAILLLILMIISMGFETASVALILPVLTLFAGTGAQIPAGLKALQAVLASDSHFAVVMLGVVLFFALKAAFLYFLSRRQAHFVFELQAFLSDRLFQGYLAKPYTFHLQHNSAQLTQVALNDTTQFARGAVMACLTLGAEIFVLIGMTGLLIIVEPWGALGVILFLVLAALSFQNIWGRKLRAWGVQRQQLDGQRIQFLQEGIGAAKEIKILGREEAFLRNYAGPNHDFAALGARQASLEAIPRFGLEFITVTGVVIVATALLFQGRSINTLVPILGVFAAAAFRLLPGISRLINNYSHLRFSLPSVHTMQTELAAINTEIAAQKLLPSAKIPANWSTIELQNVSYLYPGSSRVALPPISLTIQRGSVTGIMGPSGSGKTTMVEVLLGLLPPKQGKIMIGDLDLQTDLRGWQKQIGYVPQTIYLTDDTLRRNIAFGLKTDQIDEDAINIALDTAHLWSLVRTLPQGLDTKVGERGVRLSGGQRQRIGIARALYHNPTLLVFDEATNALDHETEQTVLEATTKLKGEKTIVIVAHRRSSLEICDAIINLHAEDATPALR